MMPVARMFVPASTAPIRLDLACGNTANDGFVGVDLYAEGTAVQRVDLFRFPFPWADQSVTEIRCSHFAEHLPARDVDRRDTDDPTYWGRDFFLAFFDECYRILRPGGTMTVTVPAAPGDRAFQDPTHRRFLVAATFLYLNAPWREANGLQHYRVSCNFSVDARTVVAQGFNALSPEDRAHKLAHEVNHALDLSIRLEK